MSSKKRPLSASFKKVEAKGTPQSSRPISARSSGSSSYSFPTSFRSDGLSNSGLSITGTKTAQSRPTSRQREGINLSTERKLPLSINQDTRQCDQPSRISLTSNKTKMREKRSKEDILCHNTGDVDTPELTKTNFYSPPDKIETLEAEKDYQWWENIPEDISFSPSTSFSCPSSISDKSGNKIKPGLNLKNDESFSLHDVNKLSSSVRNPSLTDFLDFTEDSKSPKAVENPEKAEYKAGNFQSSFSTEEWSLPEGRTIDDKENAALTIQKWYRGYKTRRREGQTAVQKVLEKQKEQSERRKREEEIQDSISVKQRRRDEKARLARQAAIQELNKKREQRKENSKRVAEEELKFLEGSGKVSKPKSKVQSKKKQGNKKSNSDSESCSIKSGTSNRLSRPSSANTLESKVEELFEESRKSAIRAGSPQMENESVSEAATNRTEKTAKKLVDRLQKITHVRDSKAVDTLCNIASSSVSGTKSTLDDLFESLRQLEEEPADLKNEKKTSVHDWLEPSGTKIKDDKSDVSGLKLTQDSVRQSTSNSNMLSQEKLRSIMSFLDEVEKTDQDTVVSRVRDPKTFGEVSPNASITLPRVDAEKELALLESASAAASDVTNAMMSVKVELEEKKKTNELLQRALNQQREFSLRQARDMEKDAKQRLELQRQEYESTIQRHLSFIDQLIDDKKILSERCEELVKKLKETDKKYVDKIRIMEESHSAEIKKQKDIMQTAEKLRREKWVKEKSQQIKELTVKGLEPDIQKLIAKHKAELKRLKSVHQAELLESDERAGRRYLHQIEELRDQLERDKETACNRERDLAQTRFQKQMEEEEQAFQQQRRRLYAEIQEEKERLATQAQKQRKELDELKEKLEITHKSAMENMEDSTKRSLEDLEQKHQLEMKELKERLEIEKQQWIENYMKKQDAVLLQKERELKEGVRESRDKEIELVIRRLEEETALARDECERAAENRIKRVRDKYESEIKELERSEKSMHDKYTAMKEKSNEQEEEVSRLRAGLKNEERKLEDLKKLTGQLQDERGRVVDIIRQEFADRLVTTDEDNKRLKIEMSELRAKHRLEIERINNVKQEEMDEVHKRVRQAISKKEETLNTMRQQKESAEKRADHLEFLLQEQRKKLLS